MTRTVFVYTSEMEAEFPAAVEDTREAVRHAVMAFMSNWQSKPSIMAECDGRTFQAIMDVKRLRLLAINELEKIRA